MRTPMQSSTPEQQATHLVVGITVRPLVASACKAGLNVCAIDLFNDLDTQNYSYESLAVGFDGIGLDKDELFDSIETLDPSRKLKVVYAGGFEHNPNQIAAVEENRVLLGNSATTVAKLIDIQQFSNATSALSIPTPEICFDRPKTYGVWLEKRVGGSGGLQVKYASSGYPVSSGEVYFEKFKTGRTITATVLATAKGAQVVGFSEQWCAEGHPVGDFVYGGAVSISQNDLHERLVDSIEKAANLLVWKFELLGLITLDTIVDGNEFWLLEINPRPGATFELHEGNASFFSAHCDAFEGKHRTLHSATLDGVFTAHSVIYASCAIQVPPDWAWPEWVCDRAAASEPFEPGDPVCTACAEAGDSDAARALVRRRHRQISKTISGWRTA